MKRVMLLVVMALAMMSATSFSLAAQELTAEEIAARLLLQKTRGLVIAPADGTAATVAGEGTAVTPAEYVPLNADEQVNIRISFEFDSAALSASEKPKLQTMCEVMKSVDVNIFKIVGHTDASGTAEYNAYVRARMQAIQKIAREAKIKVE